MKNGDVDRTLSLMWRRTLGVPQGSRGPKQRFSVDEVIQAGIAVADEEGLPAFSMRKVADRLDLEPAMLMGRVVAATPATGGPGASGASERPGGPPRDRNQAPPNGPGGPPPGPEQSAPPPRAVELTSRERRERALLAMCIALPEPGAAYLERLGERHLSRSGQAAADFIRAHPKDLAEHLPRENGALAALITELVMLAREEPASEEAMELNFLLLEQRRLEGEIEAAGERGDYERRASLSRERAALVERIAHAQRVGS